MKAQSRCDIAFRGILVFFVFFLIFLFFLSFFLSFLFFFLGGGWGGGRGLMIGFTEFRAGIRTKM